MVQQARRDAKLDVSDRIRLTVEGPPEVESVVAEHGDLVRGETLAVELTVGPAGAGAFEGEVGDALAVRVLVEPALAQRRGSARSCR